jgi:ribonuclease Z|tara:strand:+ start:440 stop:1342 length:903 start_codon:yes stop_codon:yes gene_type:complete
MKLVFLGTSGAMPTVDRALTCICLVKDNEILMFDAGEGAQISYLKSGLPWNKKMKIFVTHLHGDHCIGILGLLQTMNLQNRTEPIEIFGPDGIDEFLAANIKILNFGLSFPVLISRISTGLIVDEKDYSVFANDANHGIPAFSFRFDEKDRPGEFFPEKAKALEIPEGKLWHELQMGNSIELNGNQIQSLQVTGDKRPGRKIGVSGDTRPTDDLVEFFKNCDYLSFDSTFADELRDKAMEANHSTSKEAAELAEKANVSTLILTHFSARYHDESVLLEEAQQIHENTIAAKDLLEVDILK